MQSRTSEFAGNSSDGSPASTRYMARLNRSVLYCSGMSALTVEEVKSRWNEVLDAVLETDRIAWLAFFDARIVSVDAGVLIINFSDAQKFGGDHNFSMARNPRHLALLQEKIQEVFEEPLEVLEV